MGERNKGPTERKKEGRRKIKLLGVGANAGKRDVEKGHMMKIGGFNKTKTRRIKSNVHEKPHLC